MVFVFVVAQFSTRIADEQEQRNVGRKTVNAMEKIKSVTIQEKILFRKIKAFFNMFTE